MAARCSDGGRATVRYSVDSGNKKLEADQVWANLAGRCMDTIPKSLQGVTVKQCWSKFGVHLQRPLGWEVLPDHDRALPRGTPRSSRDPCLANLSIPLSTELSHLCSLHAQRLQRLGPPMEGSLAEFRISVGQHACSSSEVRLYSFRHVRCAARRPHGANRAPSQRKRRPVGTGSRHTFMYRSSIEAQCSAAHACLSVCMRACSEECR